MIGQLVGGLQLAVLVRLVGVARDAKDLAVERLEHGPVRDRSAQIIMISELAHQRMDIMGCCERTCR